MIASPGIGEQHSARCTRLSWRPLTRICPASRPMIRRTALVIGAADADESSFFFSEPSGKQFCSTRDASTRP